MRVSRATIVGNGLRCRCPNCGRRTIFRQGRLFKVNEACPACGLKIETGDGAFLGPFVINYAITAFGAVVPILVLYAAGKLGPAATLALSLAAVLVLPPLLYRLSWGWWLALYYFFLPQDVPGNLEGRPRDDE
jgi:uncharacterized protein (DUF983 family)